LKIEELPYDSYVKSGEYLFSSYLEACEWLDEFGFEFKKTRFGQYKKEMELFSRKLDENKSSEELESAFHAHLNAYAEATEIVRIRSALEGNEFDHYRERLKKVVSGSAFRNTSLKDQSRNFSFELTMAARFIKGGFDVELNNIADIVVFVDGVKIYVECKRIRSGKSIESNIKKANEQIKRRLDKDSSKKPRGLIAININDILNPSNDMLVVETIEELQRFNSEQLNEFISHFEDQLRKREQKKTLGVFCEYISQSLVTKREPMAICNCRGAKLYQYQTGTSDQSLIRKIAEKSANQSV
jgi:hypothetical protein